LDIDLDADVDVNGFNANVELRGTPTTRVAAALQGGSAELGFEGWIRGNFPRTGDFRVTADSTVFIEGGGSAEAVEGRLSEIRAELARASDYRDIEVLEERLARLSRSLAVIRVGAPTEVVLNERATVDAEGRLVTLRSGKTIECDLYVRAAPLSPLFFSPDFELDRLTRNTELSRSAVLANGRRHTSSPSFHLPPSQSRATSACGRLFRLMASPFPTCLRAAMWPTRGSGTRTAARPSSRP
jgi:hypothetical protein